MHGAYLEKPQIALNDWDGEFLKEEPGGSGWESKLG